VPLRFGEPARGIRQRGQGFVVGDQFGRVRARRSFADSQRPKVEFFGLRIVALGAMQRAQVVSSGARLEWPGRAWVS